MRSKAAKGSGCIGTTDDPSSWDSPLALNSTDKWRSGSGSGASYVAPWEIIFELVRVSRADRVPPPPPSLLPPPLLLTLPPPQVQNPFAVDWPLLHSMPAAQQLLVSGALLCLFREIFVRNATVGMGCACAWCVCGVLLKCSVV